MCDMSEQVQYSYSPVNFIDFANAWPSKPKNSKFDLALMHSWESSLNKGHFRYVLDDLGTKIVPGKFGFIAQLNTKRVTERRSPQLITSISEPFNPSVFNFTKIGQHEIMFEIKRQNDNSPSKISTASKNIKYKCKRNLVVLNTSPLEYCHSLLLPDVDGCHSQLLNGDAITSGLETLLLSSNQGLRLGFNSLCGFASVNHLHLHIFYLDESLYLETAVLRPIDGNISLNCHEIIDYPVPAFVFVLEDFNVAPVVARILKVATHLLSKNIAYNMFATRGAGVDNEGTDLYNAVRVFLWPRKPVDGEKDYAAFNVACCELAGHLPMKSRKCYEEVSEDSVVAELAAVAIDDFPQLRQEMIGLLSQL